VAEGERSAAAREAARLERERRRAASEGQNEPLGAPGESGDEPYYEEDDLAPAELPLGTRRVAHRERTATRPSRARARGRQPVRAKRPRPKVRGLRRWSGRIFALAILAVAVAAIYFVI
jgi:hypothetical protein